MHARSLVVLALSSALAAGCGAAPPTPAAEPEAAAPSTSKARAEAPSEPAPDAAAPTVKRSEATVPDDYELTPRDCQELARQFASLIRSDELAKLSSKLSDKQREQATASIEKAAGVRRDQWAASCEKSLVGLVQERKALTCAMSAKTVAAFDTCLNGEQSGTATEPEPPAKGAPKKKR
jgi:hypothetical protein